MTSGEPGRGFAVRVDFNRILETIAARIYDNQFAFLRENVQNAIDAVRMQARRDGVDSSDSRFRIDISIGGSVCSIRDNGIGMTREELRDNFWTMGASGKNTPEARAAGCIGTFGIGGFANFGVCSALAVVSRTEKCSSAHSTFLSRAAFEKDPYVLPTVDYSESTELESRGTIVRGTGVSPFDSAALLAYIREYVEHVREAIYFEGKLISQVAFETRLSGKTSIGHSSQQNVMSFQLFSGADTSILAQVTSMQLQGSIVPCQGRVRLEHGSLEVYKRGFKLCATSIPSQIGISGWIDTDGVRPTAGRDTLDSQSTSLLAKAFSEVESSSIEALVQDGALLAAHARMIPELVRRGLLEKLRLLEVDIINGSPLALGEIRKLGSAGRRVLYSKSGQRTPTTDVLAARGYVIVRLSGNWSRRNAEESYLRTYCGAKELDSLVECLDLYTNLDSYDRLLVAEVDIALRRLFSPPPFRLIAGKLSFDTPIFWTGKKEGGDVMVYLDTRHGELMKLKPLASSSLFWSMIEVFCREYLGETLRRQSPKFFGSGAIDLDAFAKGKTEWWDLVIGDIEVSRLGSKDSTGRSSTVGRPMIVGHQDIAQVRISSGGGVVETPTLSSEAAGRKTASKLLHLVDERGSTPNLSGYYLRLPEAASLAFGDIIRSFQTFAAIWYANRVTWQGTDCKSTAFLFDVTLDRMVADPSGALSQGSLELPPAQVMTYKEQVYFFIPPSLQDRIVPTKTGDLRRIELRNELVDFSRARSWTAKESVASSGSPS